MIIKLLASILILCTQSVALLVSVWYNPRSVARCTKQNYFTLSCSFNSPTNLDRREVFHSITNASIYALTSAISITPSLAISPEEAASSYDKFASTYDNLDDGSISGMLGINEARIKIIGLAKGRVLEIGVGTGLNLEKYTFASSPLAMDGVTSLTLLDISVGMLAEAKKKVASMNVPKYVKFDFIHADATSSEMTDLFGKETFDTVVDTFSLCVMGRVGALSCLQQMRNVVKDEGKVLLIENAKSSNSLIGLYQDLTSEKAAEFGGKGCVSNQDVRSFIMQTVALEIVNEEEYASGLFRSFVCVKTNE